MILMMNGNEGQMQGMGPWWWVIGLLVIIAVVWFIAMVARKNRKVKEPQKEKSMLDMLKEKLDRGEISGEEYEHQRRKIQNPTSIGDQTRVRHSLTSKENPDDHLANSEKTSK